MSNVKKLFWKDISFMDVVVGGEGKEDLPAPADLDVGKLVSLKHKRRYGWLMKLSVQDLYSLLGYVKGTAMYGPTGNRLLEKGRLDFFYGLEWESLLLDCVKLYSVRQMRKLVKQAKSFYLFAQVYSVNQERSSVGPYSLTVFLNPKDGSSTFSYVVPMNHMPLEHIVLYKDFGNKENRGELTTAIMGSHFDDQLPPSPWDVAGRVEELAEKIALAQMNREIEAGDIDVDEALLLMDERFWNLRSEERFSEDGFFSK